MKSTDRVARLLAASLCALRVPRRGDCRRLRRATRRHARPSPADTGVVTSLHPLSSMAGMRSLMKGGNAFDAAVATALATAVVDPKNSTHRRPGFRDVYVAKDAGGPRAQLLRHRAQRGDHRAPEDKRLQDRLSLDAGALEPERLRGAASRTACCRGPRSCSPRSSWPSRVFWSTEEFTGILDVLTGAARISRARRRAFFPDGQAPRPGEVFRQPDLARTLQARRRRRRGRLLQGRHRPRTSPTSTRRTAASSPTRTWPATRRSWVEPISIDYRGYTVYTQPPNSSGIAVLMQLQPARGLRPEGARAQQRRVPAPDRRGAAARDRGPQPLRRRSRVRRPCRSRAC